MRIAVCISGELRTARHAAEGIRAWIGHLWSSCDFFIHTWNSNTYKSPQPYFEQCVLSLSGQTVSPADRKIYQYRSLSLEDYQFIKIFFRPKTFKIEDFDWIKEDQRARKDISLGEFHKHWNPLYYSFSQSVIYKQQYQQQSNVRYDCVIKIRPDVTYYLGPDKTVFGQPVRPSSLDNLVKSVGDHSFHALGVEHVGFNDIIWVASDSAMDRAAGYSDQNLKEGNLDMITYLRRFSVDLVAMQSLSYAIHRLPVQNIDCLKWVEIYLVNQLLDDHDFVRKLSLLEPELRTVLSSALTSGGVLDQYCDLFNCVYRT